MTMIMIIMTNLIMPEHMGCNDRWNVWRHA